MNLPEGVELDPTEKRLVILGVQMPVGFCQHNLASPERTHALGLKLKRPILATDQAAHFNILCGENGWWIELSLWLDDGTMTASRPDQFYDPHHNTAEEVLLLWKETGQRRDNPHDHPNIGEYEEPCAGVAPGTWLWDDGSVREMSPEQLASTQAFMLELFPDRYEL